MKKFKFIFQKILIVIAVILGISLSIWNLIGVPEYVAAFNGNKLVKEDYQILKEYADIYAKTLDVNNIEDDVEITKKIIDDSIIITVNETRGGIKATYPVKLKAVTNEGDFTMNISYENGEYEEYSNIESIFMCILRTITEAIAFGFMIFAIIYFPTIFVVSVVNWIIGKFKKKKT